MISGFRSVASSTAIQPPNNLVIGNSGPGGVSRQIPGTNIAAVEPFQHVPTVPKPQQDEKPIQKSGGNSSQDDLHAKLFGHTNNVVSSGTKPQLQVYS